MNKTIIEYVAVGAIILFIIVSFYPFLERIHFTGYQFVTISKVSDKYAEPVYLQFHWKTEDELMTGKQAEVWIESQLPYSSAESLKPIQVEFEGIGYFSMPSESFTDRISKDPIVTLEIENRNEKIFKSETIKIRYAVEGAKGILFCDYNIEPSCTEVKDIIEVAPHAIDFNITVSKLSIVATITILVLSVILVWLTIRVDRHISKISNSNKS